MIHYDIMLPYARSLLKQIECLYIFENYFYVIYVYLNLLLITIKTLKQIK